MKDFGYGVSDHTDVDPPFGTLVDFDEKIEEAHRLSLRVILDFVPTHTLDQHPRSLESRSFRDGPKPYWYIRCDANPDGSPPNNWRSGFGGGAWDEKPSCPRNTHEPALRFTAWLAGGVSEVEPALV